MQTILKPVLSAAIGGASTAIGADLADPRDFNFHTGWWHLLEVAMGGAASAVGLYFVISKKAK